ncbi:MAG: acylphosphatase [Bacteroidales bacterium]|nr:acylphosphatase [Bacteroidales bacterium]
MNNYSKAHIIIAGRVQGVAFRYYARNTANRIGVKGWIKNLDNGDVEIMVEGKKELVNLMIDWCKKGPGLAIVEDIRISLLPYTAEFNEFNIK